MINMYPYYTFTEEFDKTFCDMLIKYAEENPMNLAQVKTDDGDAESLSKRNSHVAWLGKSDLTEALATYASRANQLANWNFDVMSYESPQYTSYGEGQFYDWHVDVGVEKEKDIVFRKLSMVITLNSEFKGGDFQIQTWNPPDSKKRHTTVLSMRKRGTIIVFPSFFYHRVTPVTEGTRKSLVCWFRGPAFR